MELKQLFTVISVIRRLENYHYVISRDKNEEVFNLSDLWCSLNLPLCDKRFT